MTDENREEIANQLERLSAMVREGTDNATEIAERLEQILDDLGDIIEENEPEVNE